MQWGKFFSAEPELTYLRSRVAELAWENSTLRKLADIRHLAISDNPIESMVLMSLPPIIQLPIMCSVEAKLENFMWHVIVKAGSPHNIQYGYYNSNRELLSAYDAVGILTALHERLIHSMASAIKEMKGDKK